MAAAFIVVLISTGYITQHAARRQGGKRVKEVEIEPVEKTRFVKRHHHAALARSVSYSQLRVCHFPDLFHTAGLDVHYVAEYHETLQHVLVFMNVQGLIPGANLEAEVVPASDSSAEERSRLLLKCGASTSPLLALPAPVAPGVKEVKVMGQYHEIKLPVTAPPPLPVDSSPALLDATQLSSSAPTSFVCASCSLPLVQASRLREYRDLPSEHWAELVDAWMCHSDQRLHDHVQKHSRDGFWPSEGEALVGGSYILFEASAVVQSNLWPATQEDHKVRFRLSCSASYICVDFGRREGRHWQLLPVVVVLACQRGVVAPFGALAGSDVASSIVVGL